MNWEALNIETQEHNWETHTDTHTCIIVYHVDWEALNIETQGRKMETQTLIHIQFYKFIV